MRRTDPPLIANWILEHFIPGERNEVLAGDLLEEFRSGRSAIWYWRQVLTIIAIRCFSEIRSHSLVLVYAALWTIPVRAWWLFALWYTAHNVGYVLPPPFSTDIGVFLSIVFTMWVGFAVYCLIHALAAHTFNLKGIVCGFFVGPLVFLLLIVLVTTIWPSQVIVHRYGGCCQFVTQKGATNMGAAIFAYFPSLVIATWRIRSHVELHKA